jgi:8-oxo-dGTP pyrophosphatase MutT (NUDIX family)
MPEKKILSRQDPQRELIARAIFVHAGALLVNKSQIAKTGEEYYALPGGHVDPGESCAQAVIRECEEELAAQIEIHDLCFVSESVYAGRKKDEARRHELVVYFHATLSTPLQTNGVEIFSPEKNKRFEWLPFENLANANLLPLGVKGFILALLADDEYPHYVFSDSTR